MAEETPQEKPEKRTYNRTATRRDKAELRAAVHEAVHEFTHLRRDKLRAQYKAEHPTASEHTILEYLDEVQPLYEEFDPVVEMSVFASDHRNDSKSRRQAMADVAPYLRPKLKQIEHMESPEQRDLNARKSDLATQLLAVLTASSTGRSSATAGGSSPASPAASASKPVRPPAYEDDQDGDDD